MLDILIFTFKCFGSCVAIVNKIRPVLFSWECNCIALHLLLLLWFYGLSRAEEQSWSKLHDKYLCPPGGVISVYTHSALDPDQNRKTWRDAAGIAKTRKKKTWKHIFVTQWNDSKLVLNERGDQNISDSELFRGKWKNKNRLLGSVQLCTQISNFLYSFYLVKIWKHSFRMICNVIFSLPKYLINVASSQL